MKNVSLFIIFFFLTTTSLIAQEISKPIIVSNNFTSKNDIWNMLGHEIVNFQADIMYIYGELYVTESMPDSANHNLPTFTEAYLFPLFNIFKKNGNVIKAGIDISYLIINIKGDYKKAYDQLLEELAPIRQMITYWKENEVHAGKLIILLDDLELYNKLQTPRICCVGVVGKLSDLDKNIDSEHMPIIQVDFTELTNWSGVGNIPFEDYMKIKDAIHKVHAQNKKISFINIPGHKSAWDALLTSKADFLNSSDAEKIANYMDEK